jgi:lipid A 3-O-deacylase
LLTLRAFAAGTVLLAALPAWCSDERAGTEFRAPWWGPEAAVLSTGFYGIRGPTKWNDAMAGLEVRGGPFFWELRLMAGALAASDGNVYGYIGVIADVPVFHVVHLILSFAPGLSASGTDHYLGIPLDFRSTAEAAFAIAPRARLGVSFSHMSNGKLAAPNPGVETLSLTLTVLALPY